MNDNHARWQPRESVRLNTSTKQTSDFLTAISYMRYIYYNKKAQLSLTNPRDAKACQKLLQFDVLAYNFVADNTGLASFV